MFLKKLRMSLIDIYKHFNNLTHIQEFEFSKNFKEVLKSAEEWGRAQACIPKQMRTFNESTKSKKTVASMIERKGDDKENKKNGQQKIEFYVTIP